MKANFKPPKVGASDSQHLAGDELEDAIRNALRRAPRGEMVPQLARAVGAPIQTLRYRLSQLAAAGIVLGERHCRFLYYRLNDSGNDAAREQGST